MRFAHTNLKMKICHHKLRLILILFSIVLMQTNIYLCILIITFHHPSNQCAMHSLGATPAQLMDGQITKSPSRERDIPCHHICKSNPFAKVIHISQVPYTSDRQKQCFTVLAEPNRTSQLKFCFRNRNQTEPNM